MAIEEFSTALFALDKIQNQCMANAEKGCRKLYMDEVDYLVEVVVWKKRGDVCKDVISWHGGLYVNIGMIRYRARACGIEKPLSTTKTEAERAHKLWEGKFEQLKPCADIPRVHFLLHRVREEDNKGK